MIREMITEDYVSFEIAKLLKEKGFDESVYSFYNQNELLDIISCRTRNSYTCDYAAPTHQMALKWLREVHSILIGITSYDGQPERLCLEVFHNGERLLCVDSPKKYEELVEEAIKMSLKNLI